MLAALAAYQAEWYLLDVCLIYALVSFLAVAVLSKLYMTAHNRRRADPHD
ncbi:MAG: hypothetical protein LBK98_07545 [Peptococcaceae bacterium]|jgi:multicomponent Na+:H+ antiporter subunit F|nr:hypothetical protein [Peptococcaceae bacterium]